MADVDGGTTVKKVLKLPDGKEQVYEAATEQELLNKVFEAHQSGVNALKNREEQIFDNKSAIAAKDAEIARLQEPKPAPPQTGSMVEEYYRIWADPARGPSQADDFSMKRQYGVTMKDLVEGYNKVTNLAKTVDSGNAVQQFHGRHQDFPATPEAGRLLNERANQFVQSGHPLDVETLSMAYEQLVREGAIERVKPAEAETKHRGADAPPTGGPGTAGEQEIEDFDWDGLSTPDMNKKLREQGFDVP